MSSSAATGKDPTKTTTINQLESIVQTRLNIKWVHAKQLIHDALRNCEIISDDDSKNTTIPLSRQDEIIEEACEIFSDLTTTEQDQMRLQTTKETTPSNDDQESEPEWKRKARIQAERREAEWQLQQNIQQNQDKIQTLLKDKQTIIPPDEIPLTTIKSIRALPPNGPKESPAPETVPIVRVRTTTCYCTIQ